MLDYKLNIYKLSRIHIAYHALKMYQQRTGGGRESDLMFT